LAAAAEARDGACGKFPSDFLGSVTPIGWLPMLPEKKGVTN
jgi:hypothetical protein